MQNRSIDREELVRELAYIEGALYRKSTGKRAGSVSSKGYRSIALNKRSYMEHRIIWVLLNGDIPKGYEIDHINGVRDDNRIENLRLVTRQQNLANTRKTDRPRSSKYKGVWFNKLNVKWNAELMIKGVRYRMGSFELEEDAARACDELSLKLNGHFSSLNFPA